MNQNQKNSKPVTNLLKNKIAEPYLEKNPTNEKYISFNNHHNSTSINHIKSSKKIADDNLASKSYTQNFSEQLREQFTTLGDKKQGEMGKIYKDSKNKIDNIYTFLKDNNRIIDSKNKIKIVNQFNFHGVNYWIDNKKREDRKRYDNKSKFWK